MQRAAGTDRYQIGAGGLAIGEHYGDADVGGLIRRVEDAGRLMRFQRRLGKRALRGNPAFGDGPAFLTECVHASLLNGSAAPR